jgi:hypothetical protein
MSRVPAVYFLAAALLGTLALMNIVWLRHYAISTLIAVFLYAVLMVVAFQGGRDAMRRQSRPAVFGAELGVIFGVIAGIGSFLIRDTLRDIDVPGHVGLRLKLLAWANSPTGHLAALLTAAVTFGVLSLLVSILGGRTVKNQQPGSAA